MSYLYIKELIGIQREKFGALLARAIFDLHGCKAKWVESVPVKETFKGETVWEEVVELFDLEGHPTTSRCYAWSHEIDDSRKRKFFVVLNQGPVKSAQDAVRAAIVSEARKAEQQIK